MLSEQPHLPFSLFQITDEKDARFICGIARCPNDPFTNDSLESPEIVAHYPGLTLMSHFSFTGGESPQWSATIIYVDATKTRSQMPQRENLRENFLTISKKACKACKDCERYFTLTEGAVLEPSECCPAQDQFCAQNIRFWWVLQRRLLPFAVTTVTACCDCIFSEREESAFLIIIQMCPSSACWPFDLLTCLACAFDLNFKLIFDDIWCRLETVWFAREPIRETVRERDYKREAPREPIRGWYGHKWSEWKLFHLKYTWALKSWMRCA